MKKIFNTPRPAPKAADRPEAREEESARKAGIGVKGRRGKRASEERSGRGGRRRRAVADRPGRPRSGNRPEQPPKSGLRAEEPPGRLRTGCAAPGKRARRDLPAPPSEKTGAKTLPRFPAPKTNAFQKKQTRPLRSAFADQLYCCTHLRMRSERKPCWPEPSCGCHRAS